MWFEKWFRKRESSEDDYEPARAAPPEPRRPAAASRPAGASRATPARDGKGFDPYNSGAFERRNAWERIGRR